MRGEYDKIAKQYKEAEGNVYRKYSLEWMFFDRLGDLRGKSVLDLGCGEGYYTRLIKERGAGAVVGIDISPKMLDIANEQEKKNPLGIRYECYDAVELPKIKEFDIVTAAFLLHYAQTKQELFCMCKNICANLKQGGIFVSLNDNPLSTLQPNKKFNYTITAKEPLREGCILEVTFYVNGEKKCSFNNYHWEKTTYDSSLISSGFKTVDWHEIEVSKEGINRFGQSFWIDYLAQPGVALIKCKK